MDGRSRRRGQERPGVLDQRRRRAGPMLFLSRVPSVTRTALDPVVPGRRGWGRSLRAGLPVRWQRRGGVGQGERFSPRGIALLLFTS